MTQNILRQLKFGFAALFIIIAIGTIGFEMIETEWDFLDSFYMTIITISTTGFKEVKPLSTEGRILTIFLIISGVLTLAYTGGKAAQILIENQIFRRRRMARNLDVVRDHYIVCGYGRSGRQICDSLMENKFSFVVIENDREKIDKIIEMNYLFVHGDASNDDILIKAGVERAKGLVSVVRTDAENVFTTLSAKGINPGLFIVARAIEEDTEAKLRKAGANRVVKPYELSTARMINLLLRPGIIDFIDNVARHGKHAISMEEIIVAPESRLTGKTLMESEIRQDLNIIVVGINRGEGDFIYNPVSSSLIEANDKLIAIGEESNLQKLAELCNRNLSG
jgi:voltage-gated potassium channel